MQPKDYNGSSLEYDESTVVQQYDKSIPAPESTAQGVYDPRRLMHFDKFSILISSLILGGVLIIGLIALNLTRSSDKSANTRADTFQVSDAAVAGLPNDPILEVREASQLAINGQLTISNSLVLIPSSEPSSPVQGQVYYDADSNAPSYYDGNAFVSLKPQDSVTALAGVSGAITLGNGLSIDGSVLSLSADILNSTGSRVTSFQGQAGDISLNAGTGIVINGTTISSSGINSINGANGVTVAINNGAATIGLPQAIGTNATPQFNGLQLASALGVSSGGTGLSTGNLIPNSVLITNNSGTAYEMVAGITGGQCLITDGADSNKVKFGSCTGSTFSGVTSLNGLDTDVSIVSSTLTVSVNTISKQISLALPQALGTTASPTFSAVSASTLTGNGSGVTNVNAVQLNSQPGSYYRDASNINAGTLLDTRLSNNVALLNAATNNFTGALQRNSNAVCDASNNCNYLTGSAANGAYVQLQSPGPGSVQTGNLNIDGDGRLNRLFVTSLSAATECTGKLITNSSGQVICGTDQVGTGDGVGITGLGNFLTEASGNYDTTTKGGYTDGTNIFLQAASATGAGIVTTGAQTFAGAKTFNGGLIIPNNQDLKLLRFATGGTNGGACTGKLLTDAAGNITCGTDQVGTGDGVGITGLGNFLTEASGNYDTTTKGGYTDGTNIFLQAASATGAGIVTTGAQTFAGAKTFNGGITVGTSNVQFQRNTTDFTTTGTSNNVDFGTGVLFRINGASAQTITGISGGIDGRIITIVNAGANAATFSNLSASSTALNRISTGAGADVSVLPGASIELAYDSASSLWRVIGGVAVSGVSTGANQQLSNLSGTVAVNADLTPDGDNTRNLGSIAASWRSVYADTSVLTPAVDTAAAAALNIGTTNATSINLNKNSSVSGTLSVSGATTTAGLTNTGYTVNTTRAVANLPTGGSIGTAATTVDVSTAFNITQATAGQTLSLSSPTVTSAGRVVYVFNTGSTAFTMHGVTIPVGSGQIYIWNGTAWILGASGGGSAITLQSAYDSGNTINTTDARNVSFTLADTTADANFVINAATGSTGQLKVQNNGTDVLAIGATGQLALGAQGATGGLLIGGDANLYRSATAVLTTNSSFNVRTSTNSATAFNVQDSANASIFSVDTLNKVVVVGASQSLRIIGGATGTRPASPVEGMIYFDTTTKQLLTYSNGKWQADRTDSIIVAANNSSQSDKDAADYIANGNTGAALDGDQVEINQALTAGSGKKVLLLAGTYTVDETILVPNNTTLAGVGNGTLIQLAVLNADENVIENSDTSTGTGMVIRDLKIDGNSTGNTSGNQNGVYLNGTGASASRTGATVSNVQIQNIRTNGIYLLGAGANNVITGNVLHDAQAGILVWGTVTNSTFSGNISYNNARGFSVFSGQGNTFNGNVAYQNSEYGMYVVQIASGSGTFVGNTIHSNTLGGFYLNSDRNIVSGNYVYNNGGATTNNGIFLSSSDANTVTGNTISDSSATTSNNAIVISNFTSDNNYLADNTLGTGTILDSGTGTIFGGQVNSAGNYLIQPTGTIELLKSTNVTGTLGVSGLASLNGGATVRGNLTINTATATDDQIVLAVAAGGAARFTGTITSADLTAARTWTLPNETGTICTNASAGACAGLYIQNQNAGAQATSNFYISGSGRTSGSFTADTSVLTPTLDTATAVALNIGTTATQINLNKSTTITGALNVSTTISTNSVQRISSAGGLSNVNLPTNSTVTTGSANAFGILYADSSNVLQFANVNGTHASTTKCLLSNGTNSIGFGTCPGGAGSPGWSQTGNSGTTFGTNFVGTTDNVGLLLKTGSAYGGAAASQISIGSVQADSIGIISIEGNGAGGSSAQGTNWFRIRQAGSTQDIFGISGKDDANGPLIQMRIGNPSTTGGGTNKLCSTVSQGSAGYGFIVSCNSGVDLAEKYNSTDTLVPGELVMADASQYPNVLRAQSQGAEKLVGIVSTKPGDVLSDSSSDNGYPIALVGRVPTKVNGEGGAIAVGDKITISSTVGIGKKATGPGMVVGTALTSFSGIGQGTIEVFVNVMYYNVTEAAVLQGGEASFASLQVSGQTTLKDLRVTGNLEVQNITIGGHIITSSGQPTSEILREVDDEATVTVEGNDTTGTITISTGRDVTVGGLARIIFSERYTKSPRVILSPSNEAAAVLSYYKGDTTDESFTFNVSNAPLANTTYKFDYFISE